MTRFITLKVHFSKV